MLKQNAKIKMPNTKLSGDVRPYALQSRVLVGLTHDTLKLRHLIIINKVYTYFLNMRTLPNVYDTVTILCSQMCLT